MAGMTRDEFEEFEGFAKEVGASYTVCQWPERFQALLDAFREKLSGAEESE